MWHVRWMQEWVFLSNKIQSAHNIVAYNIFFKLTYFYWVSQILILKALLF